MNKMIDQAKELEQSNPAVAADSRFRQVLNLAQEIVDKSIPFIPPPAVVGKQGISSSAG